VDEYILIGTVTTTDGHVYRVCAAPAYGVVAHGLLTSNGSPVDAARAVTLAVKHRGCAWDGPGDPLGDDHDRDDRQAGQAEHQHDAEVGGNEESDAFHGGKRRACARKQNSLNCGRTS
jgi:hypothetical protein